MSPRIRIMLAAGAVVTTAVTGSLVLQDARPASAVSPSDKGAHFVLITGQNQPVWSVDGYLTSNGQVVYHWYEQHSSFNQRTLWYWQYNGGPGWIDLNFHQFTGTDPYKLDDLNKNYCLQVDAFGAMKSNVRWSTGDGRFAGSQCTPD